MASIAMYTLKFYLYCKENKKSPTLGLEGEAGLQGSQAVSLVGLKWLQMALHMLLTGRPGFYFVQKRKQKRKPRPPPTFLSTQMKDAIFLPQSPGCGSASVKALDLFYSHLAMAVSPVPTRARQAQGGGLLDRMMGTLCPVWM